MSQHHQILNRCLALFTKKTKDYGTAWRILRPSSLTDQILIKAKRIHSIALKGVQKVADDVQDDYVGMINYSIIALVQLGLPKDAPLAIDYNLAIEAYSKIKDSLMEYMDSGQSHTKDTTLQRVENILSIISTIKQLEDAERTAEVEVGIRGGYQEIAINSIRCLIK